MAKEKISYADATAEIEGILEELESGDLDVDILGEKVKRVSVLLKICNDKLKKTEKDVENVLKLMNEDE
ncbi:exodeoxyribonuclease VII small subunit [Saccharicrinis aurantiacus]|uniref:exodeoxyribonuclease VII small subunit n=1 Tax=Saccharicrinis aurantiacus TaxID=1849719 RepID=UPI00083982D7|nr:exodeoxyribonuclease VII small subunit [Saccharicrinis aurantiacus]